ncbi:MAG: class I SAM-dependent methyltransferase [Proteobacteria bacterium]|nr:class I SAM-dependent methyltransferase [Pseudomonadota bacterium]MBU1595946.1 class I SAM-dependent methyltransferase [Pseudomonadota bacterium]
MLAAAVLLGLAWRLASRRCSLPCPTWLAWLVERDNPFTRTNRAASIIGQLGLQPGMAVLDLGCGPGRLALPLAWAVGPQGMVTAVDIQPGMLERAGEKARAAGLDNIRFIQADAGKGKLPQGLFDRALLVTVLGEIPDKASALKEIFAALKPGGILSVTEIIFDPHFQGRQSVTRLAEGIGFRDKAFFGGRLAYTAHFEKP